MKVKNNIIKFYFLIKEMMKEKKKKKKLKMKKKIKRKKKNKNKIFIGNNKKYII